MRDYSFSTSKLVRKMLPVYIRGRKLQMLLYSLVYPLESLSELFGQWCKDTLMASNVTSQPIILNKYLNFRLRKYFLDQLDGFSIISNEEGVMKTRTGGEEMPKVTFYVYAPECNTELISEERYLEIINSYIEKYRVAGKTYSIL